MVPAWNGTLFVPRALVMADISDFGSYQPLDSDLTAIAALSTDSFGRDLLIKTSAANVRSYIGAGTSSFDGVFASLTSKPTTIGGYGITDFNSLGDARWQPLDSDLTAVAALTTDSFGLALLTKTSAANIRTYIGAGTSSFDGVFSSLSSIPTTLSGYGITDAQPLDSDLTALAALATDSFGRDLLIKTSAANIRSYIGAGTSSFDGVFASLTSKPTTLSGYGITDAQPLDSDLTTIAGLTATTDNFLVSVASAWASRTPTQVKTTLGLTIGTNVEAWDADLDTIAGLTATTDNFLVSVSSAWASRTPTQVKSTLGLVIGTNVEAWDADLDTWAGITPGTGVGTFLATPSSANLASAITNETGSGALVFGTAPTIAGGTHTALTGLAIRDTSAAFDVTIAGTSSTTLTAGRTLTLDMVNADRTLKLTGSPTLSGITTTGTGTLALGTKTLTASNTLTLAGTDSTTMTFPTTSATIARTDAANTFTGHQTIEGVTSTGATGTGQFVFDTAPTFAASSSSAPNLKLNTGGSLQTTPSDGDIEEDADDVYITTDAGNRGYVPAVHVIRANATVTQSASDANAHVIFTSPTNGEITLETGVYEFHGLLAWTSMSATSGNMKLDILGAGTASTTHWLWQVFGSDSPSGSLSGSGGNCWLITSATLASATTGATQTAYAISFTGTVKITGGGTLIPTQTPANSAQPVLAAGSFIEFQRQGSQTLTTVGQWD